MSGAPSPLDLNAIGQVARLAGVLPDIEAAIDDHIRAIERRTLGMLAESRLTPELALYAWMQVRAARDSLKPLQRELRKGQAIGEQYASSLTK